MSFFIKNNHFPKFDKIVYNNLVDKIEGVVILFLTSKEGKETVNLNATLEKIVEQNKLETVTFTYNVVGKECKESGCNKHSNNIDDYKYVVSCKGTVTSGIDFKKVKINLDEENIRQFSMLKENQYVINWKLD